MSDKIPFRDPTRIQPFMKKFEAIIMKYWEKHPDYRFGQILTIFETRLKNRGIKDCFYLEDDRFIQLLEEL